MSFSEGDQYCLGGKIAMESNISMDKAQLIKMVENYLRWIEIGEEQLKHIQVGIEMATNNVRTLVEKLKDV